MHILTITFVNWVIHCSLINYFDVTFVAAFVFKGYYFAICSLILQVEML